MSKRIISMLLAICMVLGMFPAQVFATEPEVKETRIDMSGLASSLMANWGCFGALIVEGVEVVDYSEWTGSGAFGKYQANITVYVASEDANGTATIHVEAAENESFTASGELVTGTKSTTLVDGVGTITGAVISNRSGGANNFKVQVTFAPAPTQEPTAYSITVSASENGTVTADKAEAKEGETVTLTVTPNKGYGLEKLTVDGADVTDKVSGGKYTFTMPAKAVEVSATFVEDPYPNRVNIRLSGYEIGKVAKYASVKMYDTNGTDVTAGEWYCCVVDSNEGCNWNIGALKADTRYWLRIERYISGYKASDFGLLDMEAGEVTDRSESGNFLIYIELPMLEAPTYGITVNDATNGKVTADKAEAKEGETVTLTVTPNKGYELDTLTVDGVDVTANVSGGKYTFTMPAKAVEVSATFVEDPYPNRVNIKLSGYEVGKVAKYASVKMYDTNGTDVTAGEWYCCVVDSNEGCNWNIGELKANTRYWLRIERYISGYKASDFGLLDMEAGEVTDSSGGGNFLIYIELPMLEAPTYGITVNGVENGTVTVDKEEAKEGETVTLTVTPNKGYELDTLTVDGADVTDKVSGGKYTFTMPAKAVTVSATFVEPEETKPTVTFELGTVSGKPGETVKLTLSTSSSQEVNVRQIGFCPEFDRTALSYPNGGKQADITIGSALTWTSTVSAANSTFKDSDGNKWKFFYVNCGSSYDYNQPLPQGTAFEISYKIAADAEPGSYEVNLLEPGVQKGTYITNRDNALIDCNYVIVPGTVVVKGEAPGAKYAVAITDEIDNGTVTADKATAAEGETVTLTVTPNKGYGLETLTVDGADVTAKVSGGKYTFTMPAKAVTVNASFKLAPYAVTVSEMLGGTVTADKAEAAEGDTVTLTVKAADYYELDTLTVTDAAGNEVTVTDNAFTMPAGAVTVSATFKQTSGMEQYFTVTVDGVEYPAQYIGVQYYDDAERDCEAFLVKLPEGTTKMTVDADYKLYVLDMTNTTIKSGNDPIELAVNGAVTIYKLNSYVGTSSPHYCYLRVELPSYEITLNTPENGKLKADKTVAVKGETVTLTVTPNKGYELESLTVPGAEVTKVDDVTYTFPMPGADTEVTAVFKEIPPEYYGIILNKTQNGTVTADKTEAVMGDKVQLTITPAEGYRVDTVTVLNASGAKVAVAEDYSFIMPGSAVDVTVTFKVNAKVYIKLENYELGKKGNQVKATMTLADGSAYTTDYWYIHTATDMNSYYKGELQANTTYWLCVQTGNTKYKASDFALEGMDAVSVVDKSDSYQMLFFIELPQLKEPEPMYPINTEIYNGTVKAFVDGKEVTEASAGQTVTLEITPDEGYTLTDFYVLNAYAQIVPSVQTGYNAYTFVMPQKEFWMMTHGIYLEAWFSPYIVEGNSVVTLSDKRGALPGDLVYIPVTVTAPPSGNFYIFDLDVRLPEDWVIEGAVEGRDSRLNSTDSWIATPTQAGRWGLIAQYAGSAGVRFPEGEVLILKIRVPADAQPGTYKLDAVAASLTMGQVDSVASSFGQYVDGYVSVKAKPEQKIKLDTPEITDGMIRWYEDLVESRNIPACQQDTNAVVQYRLAESKDGLESAEWITGVVPPDDPRDDTTDSITWIEKVMPYYETNYGSLKANTKYYLQIRYSADNTTCYEDSDPYEMEFTTKAWIEEPVEISTTGAITSPGESFTVTVSLDHVFGDKEFFQKDLSLAFNNEYFTLTKFTKTNFGGSTLPEGEVAQLTFTVNDNVAPGEYQLDLTTADPIYLRYSRDGSDYYKHLRQYPVNHKFVSGTITVLEAMDAPVLTDASAGENSIEVTAPVTLDGVKVEYAISTDKGRTWSAWQESNVFENLTVNTEYQIRARYVPDGTSSKFGPSAPSEAITAKTSYDDITVSISGGEVLPGETVTVSVTFEHELTKEAEAVSLSFEYDEKLLKLDSAVIDEKLGLKLRKIADGYEIYSDEAFTVPEGDVITLTFQALESASGDVAIAPTIEVYLNDTDLMNVEKTEKTAVVHIHKVKVLEAVKVTCTTDGLTEGEQCELCEEVLIAQEVVKAEGHKYESKVTEPTCLTAGYTTFTCECGDTYYDEIKAANGHDLKKTVTDPTHEKMGYTTYKCEDCDFAYVSDWTDAIDHKYEKTVSKAATCTEDGEWTFKCECGDTYTQVMPKNGHSCEATVTAPTCEDMGYTTYECKNCDFSYINDLKDALGHKETVVGKKEATVEAEGYTGDIVCSVCETVLVKGEVIAKLEPSECICAPFTDVDTNAWYHEAVDFVLKAKLMNGTSGTTFAPQANTNRAMMVVLLYRLEGEPSVAGMENPFEDVPADTWYTDAVIWAANEGVVKGTSTTTFTPNQEITREQMVAMLWRYAGEPEADEAALKDFTDAATVSNYAKEAMAWAIETGLVSGMTKTTIAPEGTANRAQIATILMRYASK